MIRSMTGFGAASAASDLGEFSAEVRSLNNRFLDLSLRVPRELSFLEPEVREEVKKRVSRGKVELYLKWIPSPKAPPLYEINQSMLRHYASQVRDALTANGSSEPLDPGPLLALPGVVAPSNAALDQDAVSQPLLTVTRKAIALLEQARAAEGEALVAAIQIHVSAIEKYREDILVVKDDLLEEYRTKLKDRVEVLGKTLGATIDPARVETEIMFFVDKSDITEELVRLEVHLTALKQQIQPTTEGSVGKTMDFLVQEILREVNTIGNKARGLPIASRIVKMKSEIEKIREQVQNIE